MAMQASTAYSEASDVDVGNEAQDNSIVQGQGRSQAVLRRSSSSSSENTTSSFSDGEQFAGDSLELVQITNDTQLSLPRGLCENAAIFSEFFSKDTWQSLPPHIKSQLQVYLPEFNQILTAEQAQQEQQHTADLLFDGKLQKFGKNPLSVLQRNLQLGNYRPDILELRRTIAKARSREQNFQNCERLNHLAKQLFVSRERLLQHFLSAQPDDAITPATKSQRLKKKYALLLHNDTRLGTVRARKRFHMELQQLSKQLEVNLAVSSDEEDEVQAMLGLEYSAEAKSNATGSEPKPTMNDKYIYNTHFKRHYTLSDEEAWRAHQKAKQPRLEKRNFRDYLLDYQQRKLQEPTAPEFETTDIRLRDVCSRAQITGNFKRIYNKPPGRKPKIKPIESLSLLPFNQANKKLSTQKATEVLLKKPNMAQADGMQQLNKFSKAKELEAKMKYSKEPSRKLVKVPDVFTAPAAPHIAENDADGLGYVACLNFSDIYQNDRVPPLFNVANTASLDAAKFDNLAARAEIIHEGNKLDLLQDVHACFFSLIRDFFCATSHHRMRFDEICRKTNLWLNNPITALNDWYYRANSWSTLLKSAINFLTGDWQPLPADYVPYIEYKAKQNIFQWIGAGRDSDSRLTELCAIWLEKANEKTTIANQHISNKPLPNVMYRTLSQQVSIKESQSMETSSAVPLARSPTTWTVRAASMSEVAEFRRQEKQRFQQPQRAYTYRLHGYESVVGPVKGVNLQMNMSYKAKGNSILVADRPNFITILTLVRDATARLPNGEGTRADITELLKCSQYICPNISENLLQTIVSGALDRMHTEQNPCVRYDSKRKIWLYLHRHCSEAEMERLHKQPVSADNALATPNVHKAVLLQNPALAANKTLKLSTDALDRGVAIKSDMSFVHVSPSRLKTLATTKSITNTQPNSDTPPPLKFNVPISQPQKSLLKTRQTPLATTTHILKPEQKRLLLATNAEQQTQNIYSIEQLHNTSQHQLNAMNGSFRTVPAAASSAPKRLFTNTTIISNSAPNTAINKSPKKQNMHTVFVNAPKAGIIAENKSGIAGTSKNIIQMLPKQFAVDSNAAVTIDMNNPASNTALTKPLSNQLIGQRVVASGNSSMGRVAIFSSKPASSTIQVANTSGVQSGTAASSLSNVIKMSPQAFALLQQKQLAGSQRQIVINQPQLTQRNFVIGNPTEKSAVLKSIPVTSKVVTTVLPSTPTGIGKNESLIAVNSALTNQNTGGAVRTISSSALTVPQQKVLVKKLQQPQQTPQLKTFQLVASANKPLGNKAVSTITIPANCAIQQTGQHNSKAASIIKNVAIGAGGQVISLNNMFQKTGNLNMPAQQTTGNAAVASNRIIASSQAITSAPKTIYVSSVSNSNVNLNDKNAKFTAINNNMGALKTMGNQSIIIGGQSLKLAAKNSEINTQIISKPKQQNVIMGNQIVRVQELPQNAVKLCGPGGNAAKIVTAATNNKTISTSIPKTLILDNVGANIKSQSAMLMGSTTQVPTISAAANQQKLLVRPSTSAQISSNNANRLVLVQGGSGQLFLTQGGSTNLKPLQKMRVVSLGSMANKTTGQNSMLSKPN